MRRPTDDIIKQALDNKANVADAESVAAWFATPEGEKWLLQHMKHDFENIESGAIPLADNIPMYEVLHRIETQITHKQHRMLILRIAAILIPCVLLIGIWTNINHRIGGNPFSSPENLTLETNPGELLQIVFQDGTKVHLGADSRISYPARFGIGPREVELSGEAYFEVASQQKRPFIVALKDAKIKVLGTKFNIKAYEESPEIHVILDEGSISFSNIHSTYKLNPTEQLRYNRQTGITDIFRTTSKQGTLWRKGIIAFNKAFIDEVLNTIEHLYGVKSEIRSPLVYQYTYTLQTTRLPLEELLWELNRIGPVKFNLEKDKIIVEF